MWAQAERNDVVCGCSLFGLCKDRNIRRAISTQEKSKRSEAFRSVTLWSGRAKALQVNGDQSWRALLRFQWTKPSSRGFYHWYSWWWATWSSVAARRTASSSYWWINHGTHTQPWPLDAIVRAQLALSLSLNPPRPHSPSEISLYFNLERGRKPPNISLKLYWQTE